MDIFEYFGSALILIAFGIPTVHIAINVIKNSIKKDNR